MVVIKISQHGSDSPELYRFEEAPISIGRSIENRVIINDASVSSQHCEIVYENDQYLLRDTSSLNGLVVKGKKVSELELGVHSKIRLGTVKVEIFTDQNPVEKTVRVDLEEWRKQSAKEDRVAILHSILLLSGTFLMQIIDSSQRAREFEWFETVLMGVSSAVGIALIAFFISIYSKVQAKKYQYFKILRPVALLSFFVQIDSLAGDFLNFNLPGSATYSVIKVIFSLSLLFLLIFTIGQTIFKTVNKQKVAAVSGGLIMLFLFITEGVQFYQSYKGNGYQFRGTLAYPLRSQVGAPSDFKDFFADLDDAYKEIQEDREKKQKKKSEEENSKDKQDNSKKAN